MISVEVVYARPDEQWLVPVNVLPNSTVEDAIIASGLLKKCSEIDLQKNQVGVFSEKVALTHRLHPGDRVEIYRPLIISPMEARKLRSKKKLL